MRVNIKISVERKVEEDLCIYSYSDKKSYDVLSGKYSGLSRLFPTSGDYLVKIDFDADQFQGELISAVFRHSEERSYENTRLIAKDSFIAYHPRSFRGTYVLESNLSGYRCIINNDNPIYKIIPYIRSGASRRISITARQEGKWFITENSQECSSGKQVFKTWKEAKVASRDSQQRERMKAIYRCEICGNWHLTTKDGKISIRKDIYDRRREKKILRKTESVLNKVWKDHGNQNKYWRIKLLGLQNKAKEE